MSVDGVKSTNWLDWVRRTKCVEKLYSVLYLSSADQNYEAKSNAKEDFFYVMSILYVLSFNLESWTHHDFC